MASMILLIERLTIDYKRTGCGNCKRVAKQLNIQLLELAKQIQDENEN